MADVKVLYPELNTPAVLVDLDILEANIKEISRHAAGAGLKLRPHVKVHETADIARMQIAAGACGVEVGTVEQGEAMVEEGIADLLVAHPNYYGGPKGDILKKLLVKPGLKLTLVVDMLEQAEIISKLAREVGKNVPVLIKIDLGRGSRFGVPPGEPVLALAKQIKKIPGLNFHGIYGHEMGVKLTPEGKEESALEAATIMSENARLLKKEGFSLHYVSVGASSTYKITCRLVKEGKFPEITEIHPGQCIIGDILYMRGGGNTLETCAAAVLTAVMTTSHADWVMIDAGYKTFGSESCINYRDTPGFFWQGKPSYGPVKGRPDLWFGRLSAESSNVYYTDPKAPKLRLGERIEIVPNNATLVINMHAQIYGVRNGKVEKVMTVTGRGRGN